MNNLLKTIRALAGEGDYHAYRLLSSKRRWFICLKYLAVTIAHFGRSGGGGADRKTVSFIKGGNQLRLWGFLTPQLSEEFGEIQAFSASPLKGVGRFSGFSVKSVAKQIAFLGLAMLTGRRRHLNLYFLEFQSGIDKIVESHLGGVKNFICFNDQPYDVAAILNTLHRRGGVRTIVIQHGLILSEQFYFPAIAKEFWAWGRLSERHYRSRCQGEIVVKGRYADDASVKREDFLSVPPRVKILIAPSFVHQEIKDIVLSLAGVLPESYLLGAASVAIKLHPSTKFQRRLRRWLATNAPWLKTETQAMELLAEKYHILVTRNSTSAVDFLLRGKPVFFDPPQLGADFPSQEYGFALPQLPKILSTGLEVGDGKNDARKEFLKSALSV